jgi:hypothetical protein
MIQRKAFAPELEKRIRHHLRLTNDPYRVDESCVKIKGKSCDLLSVWRQKVQLHDDLISYDHNPTSFFVL